MQKEKKKKRKKKKQIVQYVHVIDRKSLKIRLMLDSLSRDLFSRWLKERIYPRKINEPQAGIKGGAWTGAGSPTVHWSNRTWRRAAHEDRNFVFWSLRWPQCLTLDECVKWKNMNHTYREC